MAAPGRAFVLGILRVLAAAAFAGTAGAQQYPAKPVRLVVPFATGGSTDIIGRIVAQRLAEGWGQPVVVENKPGAATTIGSDYVAKSAPDGYTLLLAPAPFVITQFIYPKLPYDGRRDFAPVALLATTPFVLVAHPAVPANDVQSLVAVARARPGTINYASPGSGSVPHLAMELFKARAGVELTHIPYKGGGPAVSDVVGGQVALLFSPPIEVSQHVKAGRLKVIAATTARRIPTLPEVATIDESGYRGFEVLTWFGVFVPAATPRDVVGRIAAELARVLEAPEAREKLGSQGAEVAFLGPDGFGRFLAEEYEKWGVAVKAAGVKVD
ncbi:MAG TPA: tripartite tricarboxylate transporter substrate binding protein [Burkholderiales bacterium]|nr:tripartite tricarboxylate transporter substrate binding protein [Burkholderiales bacterium]